MNYTKALYDQDYAPGFTGFSRRRKPGNIINDGIIWFDTRTEACEFAASHCFLVVDRERGIESSVRGVEYFDLQKRLRDPDLEFVFREPYGLNALTREQVFAFAFQAEREEVPYDYTGLVVGHALAKLLNLTSWIKPLRKMPVIGHLPGSLVCSNFVAGSYKNAVTYRDILLFREWHISRITPVMHYNRFLYKPFRFDKKRSAI